MVEAGRYFLAYYQQSASMPSFHGLRIEIRVVSKYHEVQTILSRRLDNSSYRNIPVERVVGVKMNTACIIVYLYALAIILRGQYVHIGSFLQYFLPVCTINA